MQPGERLAGAGPQLRQGAVIEVLGGQEVAGLPAIEGEVRQVGHVVAGRERLLEASQGLGVVTSLKRQVGVQGHQRAAVLVAEDRKAGDLLEVTGDAIEAMQREVEVDTGEERAGTVPGDPLSFFGGLSGRLAKVSRTGP